MYLGRGYAVIIAHTAPLARDFCRLPWFLVAGGYQLHYMRIAHWLNRQYETVDPLAELPPDANAKYTWYALALTPTVVGNELVARRYDYDGNGVLLGTAEKSWTVRQGQGTVVVSFSANQGIAFALAVAWAMVTAAPTLA